jgi:hypothetical protein
MFLIHTLQREEESLVFDCQQYCLEHLINRLYEPETPGMVPGGGPAMMSNGEGPPPGMITGSFPERMAR